MQQNKKETGATSARRDRGMTSAFLATTAIMRTTARDGAKIWNHACTLDGVVRAAASWTRLSPSQQSEVRNMFSIVMGERRTLSILLYSWRPPFVERCERYASLLFPASRPLNEDQAWRRV